MYPSRTLWSRFTRLAISTNGKSGYFGSRRRLCGPSTTSLPPSCLIYSLLATRKSHQSCCKIFLSDRSHPPNFLNGGAKTDIVLVLVFSTNLSSQGELAGEVSWTLARVSGEIPEPRSGHAFCILGRRGWLFGGCGSKDKDGTCFNDFYVVELGGICKQEGSSFFL